ncbi:MAG: cobalamin-dependent protein [Desulfobaccales bacterium]
MSGPRPSLLLINPWIYDFAAYDFFARPLGLLYLAGWLRSLGAQIDLLDCLDVDHCRSGPFGSGRYPKEIVPTPAPLADVPRRFGRYGIEEADFLARLARMERPGAVLVTSLMTYWYPGVIAAIRLVKECLPGVPVILGGIYASLCPDHARARSGADLVLAGPWETGLPPLLARLGLGGLAAPPPAALDDLPYPALDLLKYLSYIPILTSRGCPLNCDYCASRLLQPRYRRRRPEAVAAELAHWQDTQGGLSDVAFYDDALLWGAKEHLGVILEELARQGRSFRFHTPNGLQAGLITREVAGMLKRAGFATLRLGVETVALEGGRLDRKLRPGELEAALAHLQRPALPLARSASTYSPDCRTKPSWRWRPPSAGCRNWGPPRSWPITPPSPAPSFGPGLAPAPVTTWPVSLCAIITPCSLASRNSPGLPAPA